MKKILALIVALGMTTAMFAGCSEDESSTAGTSASSSSSAADSSSADDSSSSDDSSNAQDDSSSSSEAETTTTTSGSQSSTPDTTASQQGQQQGGAIKFEDSYTYKFQQQTAAKKFAMNLKMNYMGIDMPMEFKANGDNVYMKISASQGGVSYAQEYYIIDGKTYILDSTKKTYSVSTNAGGGMTGMADVVPEGMYEIISTKEENGMIVEQVKINQSKATGATTTSEATYYYDKATGAPKKIDVTSQGVKSTVEVTLFQQGEQSIVLPDLSGWTNTASTGALIQAN